MKSGTMCHLHHSATNLWVRRFRLWWRFHYDETAFCFECFQSAEKMWHHCLCVTSCVFFFFFFKERKKTLEWSKAPWIKHTGAQLEACGSKTKDCYVEKCMLIALAGGGKKRKKWYIRENNLENHQSSLCHAHKTGDFFNFIQFTS